MDIDVEAIRRTSRVSWPASSSSVLPAFGSPSPASTFANASSCYLQSLEELRLCGTDAAALLRDREVSSTAFVLPSHA
jgi:hypothetical protein